VIPGVFPARLLYQPMQTIVAVCFLTPIFALLSTRLQSSLGKMLAARPALVLIAPAILSAAFCAIAAAAGVFRIALAILICIYTFTPALAALRIRGPAPSAMDFALILWFWLPLEFSIGARWIPRAQQSVLHLAAYGVAVTLALVLFLLFRRLEEMKFNLPRSPRDLRNLLAGFAVAAPVLIALGRAIGFLDPFHVPVRFSGLRFIEEYLLIFAATALPEEMLFRGLIQNSLMQRLGANFATLLLAGFIFGCAHLDNGPGPLPNWRYMIVATVAGVIYGKVFERSSSVFASAGLHALVNTIKHNFF
jgi:membrane protease YdiL (CAAX protease family)